MPFFLTIRGAPKEVQNGPNSRPTGCRKPKITIRSAVVQSHPHAGQKLLSETVGLIAGQALAGTVNHQQPAAGQHGCQNNRCYHKGYVLYLKVGRGLGHSTGVIRAARISSIFFHLSATRRLRCQHGTLSQSFHRCLPNHVLRLLGPLLKPTFMRNA